MQSILRGGQVMDVVTGDVAPADVLIDGERIAAVGRSQEFGSDNGATVIDVTGLTIMPGLANNHVHLGWDGLGWDGGPFGTLRDQGVNDSRAVTALKSAVNLKKSLSVGLTAIRDLGMNLSNIDAAEGMARDIIAGTTALPHRTGHHVHRRTHLVVRPRSRRGGWGQTGGAGADQGRRRAGSK